MGQDAASERHHCRNTNVVGNCFITMRILYIHFLAAILFSTHATAQTSKVVVKLDSISQLTLTKAPFVAKDHKVEFDGNYPIAIDNKPIFGTDGEMPQTQLTSAVLTIGTKKYYLEVTGMFNPWVGDRLVNQRAELKWGWRGGQKVLRASLSDGAGSYAAEWTIVGNASIRTILSNDEWITIEYFEK